jgi:hypothetical protein
MWISAVPFKLNQDRRRRIPRQRHKVTNWPACEAGLRQRGSLTVWFTDDPIAAWATQPPTTRGGQAWYWRKLHLGIDAETRQTVASASISKETVDGVAVGPLLGQLNGLLSSFTADGAYDQDGVYSAVADRHPEMAPIAPTQRDRHLECIAEKGRMAWQKASGYSRRAKVEAAIGRWEQVIGHGLRSHRRPSSN